MTSVADLSLVEAAERLKDRSMTASDLVDSVLARARRTEPVVHAYSYLDEDRARAQAEAADSLSRRGRALAPLHGIPVALKDTIDVAGLPSTGGSRALGDFPAKRDARVVGHLRAAGAITMGKTVAHELGFGANVPRTRNAWDSSRAPGGSSAGSTVAVAVGSAMAALGTDSGGSVRVPACLNGVVGFKPTRAAISLDGVMGMSEGLDTVGTLTRSAADALLLFSSIRKPGPPPDANEPVGARIAILDPDELWAVHPAVADAVRAAMLALGELGADSVRAEWPHPGLSSAVGMVLIFGDSAARFRGLMADRWSELDPGTLSALLAGSLLPASCRRAARDLALVVAADAESVFARSDATVIATPMFPVPVGAPDAVMGDAPGAMKYALEMTMIANIAGLPAVTIPCGMFDDGLPIGLQLIGRRGTDLNVLKIAAMFQSSTNWHSRRPPIAHIAD